MTTIPADRSGPVPDPAPVPWLDDGPSRPAPAEPAARAVPPAFADWYAVEFERVSRALALAAADPALGEEAAAEAFARALARWPRVGAMSSPGAWVYTVGLNELRRTWRRRRLELRSAARVRPGDVPAPEPPDDTLWRAVAALPPRMRDAVALRYVADLPEAEIADALNVTRGTVAASLSAARKRLAAELGPRTDHENGDLR